MQNLNLTSSIQRRSSRVTANIPILVTYKDPATRFSEICETLVVSAHGCLFRAPIKLDTGAVIHFHTEEGRQTTGRVIYAQPLESDRRTWKLAAQLDRPENFWGLKSYPQDWAMISAPDKKALPKSPAKSVPTIDAASIPVSVKDALERIQQQVTDDHLRSLVAQIVQPLQAEIESLRGKLGQDGKRSKFEVSLSQIPPELEEQIEARLRKELSPKMLEQARQQSAEVLESAKTIIVQKTREGHEQFVQRITQQAQVAERRVQTVAEENAAGLREQVRVTTGELQQRIADAGQRLKRLSEEQLGFLQNSLTEQHEVHRRDLERMQAEGALETARLQAEVGELDGRMEKLAGSVHRLESGLDQRLGQMASDTVSTVRARLESDIEGLLKVLESRGTQELGKQVSEARTRLDIIQNEIEAEVSASLQSQVAQTLARFEQSLDDLARQSLAEWRSTMSRSLNSVLRGLGEELAAGSGR